MRKEFYYRKNVFRNNKFLNKPYHIIRKGKNERMCDIVIAECWTKIDAKKITDALNNN